MARKCVQITTSECNLNLGYIMTFLASIVYMYNDPELKSFSNNFYLLLKCLLYQGIPISICQNFFMHALLLTKNSGIMTMVGFIGVVFSYFLSIFRYGEPLNWLCVTGTILVIYGVSKVVIK